MSLPRQIVPGRVYLVTRRCTQRTYLLRPDRATNEAFLYCLGFAAQQTEVEVVAFLAMSNHWHGVVVDRSGRLPEFLERFHKLIAKHQNCLRGRWENFWASEQTSVVQLVDPADILRKIVYTLANPVADHLVARAHHWPGVSSLRATLHGRGLEARRPRHFFRGDGPCPPRIAIPLAWPPGLEALTADDLRACLRSMLAQAERAAAEERARTGRRLLGRGAVLRQSWRDQPKTLEPRRRLKPRFACRNYWRWRETVARNKAFLAEYFSARELWRAGKVSVFPYGTYWLRRFAGAPCASDSEAPRALSPPAASLA